MINMLLDVSECSSPALGMTLLALKRILQLIQIIGPIILILSLVISFTKGTMTFDDKKLKKKIINSIVALLLMFLVPVFINVIMGALGTDFTISDCWNNIDSSTNTDATYRDDENQTTKDKDKIINDTEYEKSGD